MLLEPHLYLDTVKDITITVLKENNIKGIILDIDNTLIDFNKNILPGSKEWVKEMKKNDIKLCIVSNTNKVEKVKKVAETLEIKDYFYFAKKPLKRGLYKAQKMMRLQSENIAVVGDQLFTDVLGANRAHMFSILVKPLDDKDIWITRIKRPIEQFFIKKFENKMERDKKWCILMMYIF